MRSRKSAEITIIAAVTEKTTPVLATASSKPARAGPAKTAMLSMPLATAFAAVSSSGVRASDGVSAACAERNGVVAMVAAIDEAVDDPRVRVGEHRGGRRADEDDPGEVRVQEDALARVAIAEHSRERARRAPQG